MRINQIWGAAHDVLPQCSGLAENQPVRYVWKRRHKEPDQERQVPSLGERIGYASVRCIATHVWDAMVCHYHERVPPVFAAKASRHRH